MPEKRIIAITGAHGRLGQTLVAACQGDFTVLPLVRADVDLNDPAAARAALSALDFDVLVNTAGSTDVDACERRPDEAWRVNSESVRAMAEVCRAKGARLVHISTDYVFGGEEPAPRREEDEARPVCVYGASKRAGEWHVLDVSPGFLVVRVSWLFGPHKPAFPDIVLRRALESDHVEAVADKFSSPTYSVDLAEWLRLMLPEPRYRGLLHLCNSGVCSWQEYGQAVLDIAAEMGLQLRARTVMPAARETVFAGKARRPPFSALDTARFESLSGVKPRAWREALRAYLASWAVPALKDGRVSR